MAVHSLFPVHSLLRWQRRRERLLRWQRRSLSGTCQPRDSLSGGWQVPDSLSSYLYAKCLHVHSSPPVPLVLHAACSCFDIFSEAEQRELQAYREKNFAEKELNPSKRRQIGKCPLTPEEVCAEGLRV